jgi:hypothetical protein
MIDIVCIRAKNSLIINAQIFTVVHLQWFVLTSKINSSFDGTHCKAQENIIILGYIELV